jgi:hypothetical protein
MSSAIIDEEILNLPDSEIPNVKFKDVISPAVYKFIAFTNKSLATTKDDKPTNRLKLLIGGGAAFNYYIKRNKKTRGILDTHDFDLRLFLDIKPSENPLFTDQQTDTEEWMLEITDAIATSFTNFLNAYMDNIDLTKKFPTLTTFYMKDRGFLKTIEYEIDGENDSLIDIVPHIPRIASHYGILTTDKETVFEQYKEIDWMGVASRGGFFKSSLIYTKDEYGIYYVSLGYLVWDTVRMLNFIIDSVGKTSMDKTVKFERYLQKYKILLAAFSRPEMYLSCKANKKFIDVCSKTRQVCTVDGKKIKNKEELIATGLANGVLPNTKEWINALVKMDFSDICKVLI